MNCAHISTKNHSISSLDMEKFPLRMKDNDLLVTELYRDPAGDKVTALSVYLTPKSCTYSIKSLYAFSIWFFKTTQLLCGLNACQEEKRIHERKF